MTVSVAMATYNGEEYIRKQLESIVHQSLQPTEVVICDDCSIDNTLSIVQEFVDKYKGIKWNIVRNDVNRGYISNFFNAIEKTTGEIIILCDQDDVWDIDKVSFFVDCFMTHKDMLSIHTDYSIIDLDDKIIEERKIGYEYELKKYGLVDFCKRLNYCGMSSAFRNSLKGALLSIDVTNIPTHDWTIHALSIVKGGMYVSNRVTSFRRFTGRNVALKLNEKTKRDGLKQRISVVKDYWNYYCLLKEMAKENCTIKEIEYINSLIQVEEYRLKYLDRRSFMEWILNMKNINKYPSKKAYICDGLYIMGIF